MSVRRAALRNISNKQSKQENIKKENVKLENIKKENVKLENIKQENVKLENIKQESVKQESVKLENVKQESVKKDNSTILIHKPEILEKNNVQEKRKSLNHNVKRHVACYYNDRVSTPVGLFTTNDRLTLSESTFVIEPSARSRLELIGLDQKNDISMEYHYRNELIEKWMNIHTKHKNFNNLLKCTKQCTIKSTKQCTKQSTIKSTIKCSIKCSKCINMDCLCKTKKSLNELQNSSNESTNESNVKSEHELQNSLNNSSNESNVKSEHELQNSLSELKYNTEENSIRINPQYMVYQPCFNKEHRLSLISFIMERHQSLCLSDESLYLTIYLINLFLSVRTVSEKKLKLLGLTALFIAAKYEEKECPSIDSFFLKDETSSVDNQRECEKYL
ncbi:Cyclin B, kinase-activating protein, partial [Pseudoloma neurophilia]